MKTTSHLPVLTFLFLSLLAAPAFAQNVQADDDKKIIITKRTTETDGTETTETIVKKGKAAANFDVEKYLKENRADNVELDVRVQDGSDDEPMVVIRHNTNCAGTPEWADDLEDVIESQALAGLAILGDEKRGFLGVTPKGNSRRGSSGVAVEIVDNSAAEKAGLKDGDVLLALDGKTLYDWDDISAFMSKTKPKQSVRVAYMRGDKKNTVDVVLGTQKTVAWKFDYDSDDDEDEDNDEDNADADDDDDGQNMAVSVDSRQKAACLGVYTSSDDEGDEKGARVTEFTEESAAQDALMVTGDVITAVNGNRVENHDDLWEEIAKYQPGDKVSVTFLRDNKQRQTEASLKPCQDNSNKVTLNKTEKNGDDAKREFQVWNWDKQSEDRFRERQVLTIRRIEGGDVPVVTTPVAENTASPERTLQLKGYRAVPDPGINQVTVEFRCEAKPTVVSLLDATGRQLFREELNAFNGQYNQQFDLTDFASGSVIVHVLQGDKVFSEKLDLK
ncbi:MAG: PDZ domain-containing protein [Saprospiraceae bacterium]